MRDAGVKPGDRVAEIGPGLGSLTLALLEAGATVVAVEVDAGMVTALAEILGLPRADVALHHADALRVDWHALLTPSPPGAVALVANLPYATATPLLFHALEAAVFARLHLMVQREVGERWTARIGDPAYGAVSVKVAAHAAARVAARVSRQAFWPVPRVYSVTVTLTPRDWDHETPRADVLALVDRGFAHRRKQLRNALASDATPGDAVAAALAATGLPATARAEELDLSAWVRLTSRLPRSQDRP